MIAKPAAVGLALLAAVVVASIVTDPQRLGSNDEPLLPGAQVPPEVRAAIDRSCRDCHSDATRYPWYSHIAPISWLIGRDVERGRGHLNFSKWSEYSVIRRERLLSEIANQVQDGFMPLGVYTWIHRGARLSQADVSAIFEWTQAERARLIAERAREISR